MYLDGYRQWTLGSLYAQFGQVDRAIAVYHQALYSFRQVKDTLNTAKMLNRLGELYALRDDLPTTLRLCQAAERLFCQENDLDGAISALRNVAMVHYQLQHPEQAIKLLERVLADCDTQGDRFNEAITLTCLAQVYGSQQQYLFALACQEAALEHFQTVEDLDRIDEATYRLALSLCHIGQICVKTGHSDVAIRRYGEALTIFESAGMSEEILSTLATLCQLHGQLEQYCQALAYRQRALSYESQVSEGVRMRFS